MSTHGSESACGNFNCIIKTDGLFMVTGSNVYCECCNTLETVQDREIVTSTTDHY